MAVHSRNNALQIKIMLICAYVLEGERNLFYPSDYTNTWTDVTKQNNLQSLVHPQFTKSHSLVIILLFHAAWVSISSPALHCSAAPVQHRSVQDKGPSSLRRGHQTDAQRAAVAAGGIVVFRLFKTKLSSIITKTIACFRFWFFLFGVKIF